MLIITSKHLIFFEVEPSFQAPLQSKLHVIFREQTVATIKGILGLIKLELPILSNYIIDMLWVHPSKGNKIIVIIENMRKLAISCQPIFLTFATFPRNQAILKCGYVQILHDSDEMRQNFVVINKISFTVES